MLTLKEKLDWISYSVSYILPEIFLMTAMVSVLITGLIKKNHAALRWITLSVLILNIGMYAGYFWPGHQPLAPEAEGLPLFLGMLRDGPFTVYFKILFAIGGILTVAMSGTNKFEPKFNAEYYLLLLAVILGANLLVMSVNYMMMFISVEIISLSSYVLAGFSFTKKGAEGSLKYFLFGAVASAVMLYGFSILYGLTGSLSIEVMSQGGQDTGFYAPHAPLFLIGVLMALSGILFKIVAVPMHPWAPDVYEASPMPVVAFFSVVPKLAGVAIFARLISALNVNEHWNWQIITGVIALATVTVGNFSALAQKSPRRMMAYSSIAQAGMLLICITSNNSQGIAAMAFYSFVYLTMNFLVFICLQYFETQGIDTINGFSGVGKRMLLPVIFSLVGLIALTGLPPTAGFTGKLFIFSSLWENYATDHQPFLLLLLIAGLLNTVVSLFFYLKIPYYAFLKSGEPARTQNNVAFQNLLAAVLVLTIVVLFFLPGLLMGWIYKIIFAD